MSDGRYSFRSATRVDLPMLRRWLETPAVARWWSDPDKQYALLEQDLGDPRMVMRIVSFRERPFAYAQDYDIYSWGDADHFDGLPEGTRAIDVFIGEPDMIGRGHGSRFIRILAERLRQEGAPLVAIDPDVTNVRARRAYEKAGFKLESFVETAEGPAALMLFERGAWGATKE
ncbi:MAG TPA: GNAT family N-acetyltransferase [Gammaproteobacteria bacterium]|nr:GNAT family N-acetyltransferase [Gammaproteobacteria bacterium]